jgi:hypothetical protein
LVRRRIAITVLAAAGFAFAALAVDEPARTPAIQAATYVLAWRLTLLIYIGRRSNPFVFAALPALGGWWIAEWWAVALAGVNLSLALTFWSQRHASREPATWRELAIFVGAETALLAVGVGLGLLTR